MDRKKGEEEENGWKTRVDMNMKKRDRYMCIYRKKKKHLYRMNKTQHREKTRGIREDRIIKKYSRWRK